MKAKHWLEYSLLRTVILLFNLLPVPAIRLLCTILGFICWVVFPFRLEVAHKNLSTILPELTHPERLRLLRRIYSQLAKTFGLVFILHRKKLRDLVKNAKIEGREELDSALGEGKGVILTTIHATWFEAYFAWFNLNDLPTSLIYQKQSNPFSDRFFIRQRSRFGASLEHVPSCGGMKTFQEALLNNRLLIISLDQRYSGRGTSVPLFNNQLPCAKGSAILHLRTDAPVLTSVYYMRKGKLHIDFGRADLPSYRVINEESINDISTRCIKLYEPFIRQYPEQWFSLFHRLWSKKDYPQVKRSLKQIFL